MLYTSKAIVLKKIRYSDNSFITHMFTEEHGHQTFLISKGSGKNKKASALLFPLTILEISSDLNPKRDIQRIKSMHIDIPFQTVPFDHRKSAIAQFLSEVYFECIKTDIENRQLFNFLKTSIEILDIIEHNIDLFHLKNMLELSRQMGFFPTNNYSDSHPYFNVANGKFTNRKEMGSANKDVSLQLSLLDTFSDIENFRPEIKFEVGEILNVLVNYFEIHLESFKKPKSMDVFRMLI
ncbi:DNA repair protein RecO [Saccharicrinis sp. FJH54]|uniref:DNA repair protein RecO n=1 Tax=Saccharicrinis sp. FJH54 TaxID=3344665 RepID=UPI0035D3DB50